MSIHDPPPPRDRELRATLARWMGRDDLDGELPCFTAASRLVLVLTALSRLASTALWSPEAGASDDLDGELPCVTAASRLALVLVWIALSCVYGAMV